MNDMGHAHSAQPGFTPDIRISPKPAILALAIAGALIGAIGGVPRLTLVTLPVALLILALSGVAWALEGWRPRLGAAFAVFSLMVVALLARYWLGVEGALVLLALPPAFATAVIGLPAGVISAAGSTALLVALWQTGFSPTWGGGPAPGGAALSEIGLALVLVWTVTAVQGAVIRPVQHIVAWTWNHYRQAQGALDEARSHRAQLAQALNDLAQANRQLALMNERLAAARAQAEEAQRAKAAFVANVSHEFRTPLNMIIGLTDLLLETPDVYGPQLPAPLFEDLEIVRRNCEHLSAMINDVLDLSQSEAGRLALHRERVALAEVVERAVAVVRPLLEKKKLTLEVKLPPDLPDVYCDRTRIRQVIVNLLSNAARYTERGGIDVRVRPDDGHVIVSVSDTGPGIPAEDAEHIFEPFYRGAQAARSNQGGGGLGLSISKQFVEMHDGEMWLESTPGAGSTFHFRLPVSPPVALAPGPVRWLNEDWIWRARTERAALPVEPGRPRVLLCDASGELADVFTRYGGDAVEYGQVASLTEAADDLQRLPARMVIFNAPTPPALWALVAEARRAWPDLPIVGCCLPPHTEHALAAGASGYLLKPVTRAELEAALARQAQPARRVLIVDDDPDARQLFRRMLLACPGVEEVIEAASGAETLAQLRSARPDLALLDIVLPDMDGWQVLRAKTEDPSLAEIPVIMLTAQDPADRPAVSEVVMATLGEGVPVSGLLRFAEAAPALLKGSANQERGPARG